MTPSHPTADDDPNALHQWLRAARQRHAEQAADVAQGLLQRAATLPADADGADAIRLAEHICPAHLADAALPPEITEADGTRTWCAQALADLPTSPGP